MCHVEADGYGWVGGAMGSTNSFTHIPGSDMGHVTRSRPMKREKKKYIAFHGP